MNSLMNPLVNARLLIVDDEAAHLRALCDTLQDQGFVVTGCTGGVPALQALREDSFDLLLTDLMMPGMDGLELLAQALQIDATLAVVIMTGAGSVDTAVEAMRSGAVDYVLKPFKLSLVLPVLGRGLKLRQLRLRNEELARQLQDRAEALEATNSELDAFTRSASHDLRTPLNAVAGFSGLLAEQYAPQWPEEARHWLAQIERAGARMNQLIDDLLRLSRLGRQALSLAPVDLGILVRGVIADLRMAEPGRQVALHIDPLPRVMGDAGLLQQVFTNLLSNAFKFTRRTANAEISIGTETLGDERVIYVRDNGSGFDMAQAERLFGAFERLHPEDQFEGTGIGLSIVQRIVQRHGGRVWATGAPGLGATFRFTLGDPGEPVEPT